MTDSIKLSHFIFACLDIDETESFYTEALGMRVLRRFEHGDKHSLVLTYNEKATTTVMASPPVVTQYEINLRFEANITSETKTRFKKAPLRNNKIYLVLYTREMSEVVRKVESSETGAWVYIPPTDQFGVKIAILVDPNGMAIRLVEMNPLSLLKEDDSDIADYKEIASKLAASRDGSTSQSFSSSRTVIADAASSSRRLKKTQMRVNERATKTESGGVTWVSRIGYLVVPCDLSNELNHFYELHFSTSAMLVLANLGIDPPVEAAKPGSPRGASTIAAAMASMTGGIGNSAMTSRVGFTVVDREDFPEVLSAYTWLANGPRSMFPALCLMQRVERKTGLAMGLRHRSSVVESGVESTFRDSCLMGIGFETPQLAKVTSDMAARGVEFLGDLTRPAEIVGIGNVLRFMDPNNLMVEVTDGESKMSGHRTLTAFQKEVLQARDKRTATLTADREVTNKFHELHRVRRERGVSTASESAVDGVKVKPEGGRHHRAATETLTLKPKDPGDLLLPAIRDADADAEEDDDLLVPRPPP